MFSIYFDYAVKLETFLKIFERSKVIPLFKFVSKENIKFNQKQYSQNTVEDIY